MNNPFWELVLGQARVLLRTNDPEQKDIAVLVGQSESAVSNWKRGAPPTSAGKILELAAALNMDHAVVWAAITETLGTVIVDEDVPKGRRKLTSLHVRTDRPRF